jgi:hypothetical protein
MAEGAAQVKRPGGRALIKNLNITMKSQESRWEKGEIPCPS